MATSAQSHSTRSFLSVRAFRATPAVVQSLCPANLFDSRTRDRVTREEIASIFSHDLYSVLN